MRRHIAIIGVIVACLGCAALLGVTVAQKDGARARAPASGEHYLGRVAPGTRVRFGLSLRMRGAALERYAASVGTGSRPSLSAAQIGRRFGIPAASVTRLRRRLGAAGVRIEETFPQRTEIEVSASASSVERLFGVGLGEFADAGGVRYHRPLSAPVIPRALRPDVVSTTQLDTKRIPVIAAVPSGGMKAVDLAALYDLRPLINQGLDGSGQTVAVFSEDTFRNSDISAFDAERHIVGAPPVARVGVPAKGVKPVSFTPGDGAAEVDLDIEIIRELAPKSHIINYETPCCGPESFVLGINRIVKDGKAKLANFSYGYCELYFPQQLATYDLAFAAAAASGVTVFASSGDQGSYECQRNDRTIHVLSVSWPGSSPNVVSVGGTYVDVRQDGTRLDEVGWENILSRGGGGGGVSARFARPSWQAGVPGIRSACTTNPPRRQLPDVSADADGVSGYAIYTQGQNAQYGGTSASAPFWTGSFALIDQLAQRRTGRRLSRPVAPLLYQVAARDPAAFYDVRLGGNRYYRAGPGWDCATGLGTPDMAVLARDLVAQAAGHR